MDKNIMNEVARRGDIAEADIIFTQIGLGGAAGRLDGAGGLCGLCGGSCLGGLGGLGGEVALVD
ncbi:hypothetical protein C5167_049242 [Papaver somniferum]|uniref:Uncharacterized protein n=1 Tax=Papaver somniferum TaxID=3469 RepID=A0A4Y7KNK9_PAPSO|nr:hypothetical protein C5167_049242 [Papaver somniferum]